MMEVPDPDAMEWFIEQLYLSAYWNHDDLDDVDPGYEYAVNQLMSDMQGRLGYPTKDMEMRAMKRAQDKHDAGVRVE